MKRTILFILLILNIGIVFSVDYTKIDKQAESVPQNLKTAQEITRYLTRNLSSQKDKVRAIYYWIAHTIRYDVSKMNLNETYTDPQELVDEVLKNRKGVCANYAALFNAFCKAAGIQSYIIEGYTRQNEKTIFIGHAWNAVKIDNKFYCIDATWASGYVNGRRYTQMFRDKFFMIPPVEFIRSHMAFDPVWQFSNNPITHNEFENGDFSNLKTASNFNYADSIKVLSGLSLSEKLSREDRRIIKSGVTNNLIRSQVALNQQQIISEKYNLAAETFNSGVVKFNYYVQCKNKQFQNLSMGDDKILGLLSATRQSVESAERTLSNLKTNNNELNHSISDLEKTINGMKKNLDLEDKFVSKYVKTGKSVRMSLFYRK